MNVDRDINTECVMLHTICTIMYDLSGGGGEGEGHLLSVAGEGQSMLDFGKVFSWRQLLLVLSVELHWGGLESWS